MTTRETITLDTRAQQRLLVLTHVLAGELAIADAAAYLRLSGRQVTRLAERRCRARLVGAEERAAALSELKTKMGSYAERANWGDLFVLEPYSSAP